MSPAPALRPIALDPPVRAARLSPFRRFSGPEWGRLRAETPLPLSEEELAGLRGRGETIRLEEVCEIYLPLSRLLNLHVAAAQHLHRARHRFLGQGGIKTPYLIGLAGSVAVGKSTTARLLRLLLARWPDHPRVALVTTDGFLHPNAVLEARGLMQRKGWPESFDLPRLLRFVAALKSGCRRVRAPVYSHQSYDIVPGEEIEVARPDIVILEGLNVLQPPARAGQGQTPFVSDFFDFSIYLDAEAPILRNWYIERFLSLRATAFRDPEAYFHRYATLPKKEAARVAQRFWKEINRPNLMRNILPTRARADLILSKRADHSVGEVWLRKS